MEATTTPATTSARTPLADPQDDDQCVLLTIVAGDGITHQPAHERVVAEYRSNQYLDALELEPRALHQSLTTSDTSSPGRPSPATGAAARHGC